MKDALVLSFEGIIRVNNAPRTASQGSIVEIARRALQDEKEKALTGLNNIEYMTESKMYQYFNEMEEQGINVKEHYIEVDFDDYK